MEIDEEYIEKVKSLIEQKDAENVKTLLTDLHPADIAELCNDLGLEEARFVYRLLHCFHSIFHSCIGMTCPIAFSKTQHIASVIPHDGISFTGALVNSHHIFHITPPSFAQNASLIR